MSFESSSPATELIELPNTDPFDAVAYTDIVETSVCCERELEIDSTKEHNTRQPVSLEAFERRYISAFNRYPSLDEFEDHQKIIDKQLIADGLPSSPICAPSPTLPTEESITTLSPSTTPPANALMRKLPHYYPLIKTRAMIKSSRKLQSPQKLQSPIKPRSPSSKLKNLQEDLQMRLKYFQHKCTNKLSPIQAGQLASELAGNLSELAHVQAQLQQEYIYMLELSLSGGDQ